MNTGGSMTRRLSHGARRQMPAADWRSPLTETVLVAISGLPRGQASLAFLGAQCVRRTLPAEAPKRCGIPQERTDPGKREQDGWRHCLRVFAPLLIKNEGTTEKRRE